MKTFKVNEKTQGKRVVRAICTEFPKVAVPHVQKALRNKDIRINGKRVKADEMVCQGDEVSVYLSDEILEGLDSEGKTKEHAVHDASPTYTIPYQDENILVVNKSPGIPVHPGENTEEIGISLIEQIRSDLGNDEITLCHRIDMNTGGLLLLARNKTALASVIRAMEEKQIHKRYRCLVRGIPDLGEEIVCEDGIRMKEITAFLEKPSGKGDVYIHDEAKEGDLSIITRYRILSIYKGAGPDQEDVSELEVELVTGRTHQIRAHFAHVGHPLLGDGKYGRNAYNRFFEGKKGKLKHQQLFATSLHFGMLPRGDILAYLSNRTFSIEPRYDISFRE